jgi:poly(A) polymerase Pap1
MPIITPAYPQQNASYNVCESTLHVMKDEFDRGAQVADEIMAGKHPWGKIWEENTFFLQYKTYITITAFASTPEDHNLFQGLVESTVRFSVKYMEKTPPVILAVPFPKVREECSCLVYFPLTHTRTHARTPRAQQGFDRPPAQERPEGAPDSDEYKWKTVWFIGLKIGSKEEVENMYRRSFPVVPPLNIEEVSQDFYDRVRKKTLNWPEYKPSMDVLLSRCLPKDLPDYVFPDGIRPRPKKKVSI